MWLSENGYDCAYDVEDNLNCTPTTSVSTNNEGNKIYLNPSLNPYYGVDPELDIEDNEHRVDTDTTFENVKITENLYYEWSFFLINRIKILHLSPVTR